MSNGINRSSVVLNFTDVYGQPLQDTINVKFYNVRLQSEKIQVQLSPRQLPATVKGLAAAPHGLTQVYITPKKYRSKSLFENVQSDGSTRMDEAFFVDPAHVQPNFPVLADVQTQPAWAGLARLLRDSGISTPQAWNALDDQQKAGLLNLYCKMNATLLDAGRAVTGFVQKVDTFLPARILAHVAPNLIELVSGATDIFHTVPGALHSFDPPWQPVKPENSWKTFDSAGNLQLTFAEDGNGGFFADIDIDDHQGVQHAFDVIQHTVTGKDTNPYDIHEILVFFQQLDPGYTFA